MGKKKNEEGARKRVSHRTSRKESRACRVARHGSPEPHCVYTSAAFHVSIAAMPEIDEKMSEALEAAGSHDDANATKSKLNSWVAVFVAVSATCLAIGNVKA